METMAGARRIPIEDHIDLHTFLPKEIPSVVEEYLDGGGLTRFRALLAASAGRGVDQ